MEEKSRGDIECEIRCKALACAIQKCLKRRRPNQNTSEVRQQECKKEIRVWKECCDRVKEELQGD